MKSLEELKAIREKVQAQMNLRDESGTDTRVVVGMATCGIAAGARPVLNKFVELVQGRKLNEIQVTQTGCIGMCRYEPIVEIHEPGKETVTYIHMDAEKAERVFEEHLLHGNVVNEYLIPAKMQAK